MPAPVRPWRTRLRPYWWVAAVPLLVGLSALWATSPIRDAVTLRDVPEATLQRPAGYILLGPVSALLDTLTLLSLRQHVAVVLTLALGYGLWWWRRGRCVPVGVLPARRFFRRAVRLLLAVVALALVYAAAILMPRPMAGLDVGPSLLAIDFHAHTQYSHDGRWHWSPDRVRAWHRETGYAVSYISDHRTFEGARAGWATNPSLAGENTVLLPAIEVVWNGEHINVLDADRTFAGLFTPSLRDIDVEALRLASLVPGKEPVLVETLPGDLGGVVPARGTGTAGVRAIELIDGSPKGLGQVRRERARIIRLADSLHLALVSGSDSHGWGYVAQGWTLMSLPGWRGATPAQLGDAIAATIRHAGARATRVVERRVADTESWVALPFTLPLVLWTMLCALSPDERVLWLAWTVAAGMLVWWREHRRATVVARVDG
jgi:hypothetical protein